MNIPHEWHDGEALLPERSSGLANSVRTPPLVGTPYDAAGRIILALQGLGLTVLGVAITDDRVIHMVVAAVPMTLALAESLVAIPDVRDVRGNQHAGTPLTRLRFVVG